MICYYLFSKQFTKLPLLEFVYKILPNSWIISIFKAIAFIVVMSLNVHSRPGAEIKFGGSSEQYADIHPNKECVSFFNASYISGVTLKSHYISAMGTVHNVTQNVFYLTIQDAINAANPNDVIQLTADITESLVNVNKNITLDGNGFILTSSSATWGIEIGVAGITILNFALKNAGTFGIQTDCGADNLIMTNVTVDNCGGTGISIYGIDNAVLTNITSKDNGGNGINFTNCDNTILNGLTTSGNNFPGGFEAGIGIFTSHVFCLPGGINGLTVNGPISIAESTKAYSQKTLASHVITGLASDVNLFDWAVGIGALDRNYWTTKAIAYTVVDVLFEAPFSYPNSVIYVVEIATENYYVDDNPAGDATPPMLIQTAINFLTPGKIIHIEDGTYAERLTVDKSLTLDGFSELGTMLNGTGLVGFGSGIYINSGITDVSIQDLSIRNFAGNAPNSYAGIYASLGNNNLSVKNCTIKDNVGGCGFYANGPVNLIDLDNLDVSGHSNVFGAARGIVIWNGFKEKISITNCDVYNNNCCGIELSDGTASGVTMSNNNVHDNADNGFGLLGLKGGSGANLISNNTVSNNGRFGIEIKNPNGNGTSAGDGSIYVDNNVVNFAPSVGMNIRDHAGIAIFRRSFQAGNPDGYPDVPTGVVVKNNTVDGYKHLNPARIESEGFGIVVEGTNHEVTANTINNNDIGIQQQGGGHPNPNYFPNTAGDGDQADNKSALYFGRGNAPIACGNDISGNTFLLNGANIRTNAPGSGGNGYVTNTNTLETFCTIQAAINDINTLNGHTLIIGAGTYAENVIVNKSLTILGPNYLINPNTGIRVAEAIVVPGSAAISFGEIFHVAASNVTISGLTIDGDNPAIFSGFTSTNGADIDAAEGITVYETLINGLTVNNNIIKNVSYFGVTLYDFPAAVPSSGHVISNNKIEDLGTYDPGSGIDYWGGGVLLYNNQYAHVSDNVMTNVRIGIQTGNFHLPNPGSAIYQQLDGNSIQARRRGIFHNLHYSTASPFTISNHTITGLSDPNEIYWDGILLASLSVSSTSQNNVINGTGAIPNVREGYEVWNVKNSTPAIINGGSVTGVDVGLYVNNYDGYTSDAPDGAHTIVSGLTITNCENGVLVHDDVQSTHAPVSALIKDDCEISNLGAGTGIYIIGAQASATINDNDASVHGFAIGIDVDGGTATITNNHIYENGTGIRVINGGSLTPSFGNFINVNTFAGIHIAANAGTIGGINNNDLSGNVGFAIRNLSTQNIDATCNWYGTSDAAFISSKISGNVTYTPYLVDGTDFDLILPGFQPVPGSCLISIPKLSTTINGVTVNANNDGIDDTGAFSACNALNNIQFGPFIDQNGFSDPLLKVYQTYSTVNVTVPFCNNCSAPMAAFNGVVGTASLIDPTMIGTLTMSFRSWLDINNDGVVDPGELASDWIVYTITILPNPPCLISGTDGPVCPSSSDDFDGTFGMTSYTWSVTGDATIFGPNDLPFVTVVAGPGCDTSYTLTLEITDNNGCTSTCQKTILVQDLTAPILTGIPYPGTTGTNACIGNAELAAPFDPLLAVQGYTDNCRGPVTASLTNTSVEGTNCAWTVTYTFTVFDGCNNPLVGQTYSNSGSNQEIFSITCAADASLSCQSDVPPGLPFTGTVNNNCGSVPRFTFDDVITNQICRDQFTLTRTYTATNECNQTATCTIIYTVFDNIHPSIICPPNINVSCATDVPPDDINQVFTADGCGNTGITVLFLGDVITDSICPNKFVVNRTYQSTDICGNAGTCVHQITVNDNILPTVLCKALTVYLNSLGTFTIRSQDLDFGSVDNCGGGALTFEASDSVFTCAEVGPNTIAVTVTDICGNSSSCLTLVTVLDTIKPVIVCPTFSDIHLLPGECGRIIDFIEPFATDNCNPAQTVIQTDLTGLHSGSYFPIGQHCLSYIAIDPSGNISTCSFCINLIEFDNPNTEMVCNDDVQISLDDSCRATIGADLILEGNVYGCFDRYIVQVRLWSGGGLIDREPNRPGTQIDGRDVGKELKITVIDPRTGNSCWGKAFIEDKLPPLLICPRDTTLPCSSKTDPLVTGVPFVYESCGDFNLTFVDQVTKGGCTEGFELTIIRTWTAIDAYGNKSTCIQNILVLLGNLLDIDPPFNYDNTDTSALLCELKIDRNKNIIPHLTDSPECVDGYLLDSLFWLANPAEPNIYPNRRLPRILGWNCIDITGDPNFGHPNPDPVYYPPHPEWSIANPLCWGPDTHIMWLGTGRPTGSECTNLGISYSDLVFDLATPGCNAGPVGCYKILRKWVILDWCTAEIRTFDQVIKVVDQEGPQIIYPDSVDVTMDVWACRGRWDVPKPWITDNCSEDLHFTLEIPDGIVLGDEIAGYVVVDLPAGVQHVYIVAEDCCGNITKKLVVINVQDNTPPTAVCEQKTTVTISGIQNPSENTVKIYAQSFDDGSFDNCSAHLFYKVIRMDELLGTNNGSLKDNKNFCKGTNGDDDTKEKGNQIYFDDFIKFCCDDVGNTVLVVFRVFDKDPGTGPVHPADMNQGGELFNHYSDCMVEVEVQDKNIPTVVAPPDIVVSCGYWFDLNKLTDPNDSTFGKVVNDIANRDKVITHDLVCHKFCEKNEYTGYPGYIITNQVPIPAPNQACLHYNQFFDTAHWDRKYDLLWGFDGYALSSCGTNATIVVNDLRECGQGRIQRVITALGPNNFKVTAIQTIWVVDCDPFYVDPIHCNDTAYSDIIWPKGVCDRIPVEIEGCGTDISPDNPLLGRPQIANDADDRCALIAIEHFDQIFIVESDACYKILRNWVVIDWCQYDPNIDPRHGRWEALQLIKVNDHESPVVTCNVGPCEPAVYDTQLGYCFGHINLTATAYDSCTPNDWLYFEYKIDEFNDGTYDYTVGRITKREFNAGIVPIVATNPYADDPLNPFNASGNYPIGRHKIKWFVEDGCGSIGTCETLFDVKDCKAPTPYCLTGLITVPMPSTGCVDIWAKDLDANSSDNCTPRSALKFYFNGDTSKPSIRVCCSDFEREKKNDELVVEVQVWVEDLEGNKDYCITSITVQDNQNICPNIGTLTGTVSGILKTEKGDATSEALVELYANGIVQKNMTTTLTGTYVFFDLTLNENYFLKASKDGDYLNGVTTADIVKLQRHILGMEELNSPYKLLAADVNRSGNITAKDMSDIRKLILGVTSKFDNSPSWLFLPQAFTFDDIKAPWTYSTQLNFTAEKIKNNMDFIAVKIGDVNNTVKANAKQGIVSRSNSSLQFIVDEMEMQAGTTIDIPVYANNFRNISGYQFTIKMDAKSMKFEGFKSGALVLNESNFGLTHAGKGVVTTSWNSDRAISVDKNEVLFILTCSVQQNTPLSKAIMINSDITAVAAYDAQLTEMNIELGIRNGSAVNPTSIFELYQNNPNPFDKQTTIQFTLPESTPAVLTIYDVTGKVVYKTNLSGQKGVNLIHIAKQELSSSGVLYYQLDASGHTATKRMILIE